jgi:hypothetical protein
MIHDDAIAVSTPPAGSQADPASAKAVERIALSRRQDRLHVAIAGADPVPARIVLMRPVSEPHGAIAILADDQRCLAEIAALPELETASRAIAAEELRRRYCVAEVLAVLASTTEQGNRYLRVSTDRGERQLLFRDPDRALIWVTPDHVLMRDLQGNRFRISSIHGLDAVSRGAFMKAL